MTEEERANKNAVFGAPPVDPRGVPVQTFAERVRSDFNMDIPSEVVPLPSTGLCYPPSHPFHGRESVDIYAMSTREEDILTNAALLKKGTVISELIRSCLVEKRIDSSDLLTGDRNALMVAIRITGYGKDYPAQVTCDSDECQTQFENEFNLLELPIQRLELQPLSVGQNLFEFVLPVTKKLVKFRFLTGRDEEEMIATAAQQKKHNLPSGATNVTTSLLRSLVSVDGIEDRSKLANFVKAMPARDSLSLRTYIRNNEPGIRMRQTVVCPSCEHESEVSMPIGANFLWPNS
jgi:hypothetical protein